MASKKTSLSKKPQNGIHIEKSKVNNAYLVMWHRQVLRICNTKGEAEAYAQYLLYPTANDPGRRVRRDVGNFRGGREGNHGYYEVFVTYPPDPKKFRREEFRMTDPGRNLAILSFQKLARKNEEMRRDHSRIPRDERLYVLEDNSKAYTYLVHVYGYGRGETIIART